MVNRPLLFKLTKALIPTRFNPKGSKKSTNKLSPDVIALENIASKVRLLTPSSPKRQDNEQFHFFVFSEVQSFVIS